MRWRSKSHHLMSSADEARQILCITLCLVPMRLDYTMAKWRRSSITMPSTRHNFDEIVTPLLGTDEAKATPFWWGQCHMTGHRRGESHPLSSTYPVREYQHVDSTNDRVSAKQSHPHKYHKKYHNAYVWAIQIWRRPSAQLNRRYSVGFTLRM